MRKHDSLRAALTAALPELARDPDALAIYIEQGRIAARFGHNLGWEYRYDCHLTLINWRSAPEQVFLPLVLWLRQYQHDSLLNHERGVSAIKFNVDVVDADAVDIEIILPLTEAVDVLPQQDGSYRMTLREEPPIAGTELVIDPAAILRQIYAPSGPERTFIVGHPDPSPDP
jgi:hypothetical protein